MSKKWAEDYSSEEGSGGENDINSDEEMDALPNKKSNRQYNITAPSEDGFFAVFVSQINFSMSRKDIGEYFENLGCKLTNLQVETGGKGTASIKLVDKASFDIAMANNGSLLGDRNIKVVALGQNEVVPKENAPYSRRGPDDVREKGHGSREGHDYTSRGRGRGGHFSDRGNSRRGGPPSTGRGDSSHRSGPSSTNVPSHRSGPSSTNVPVKHNSSGPNTAAPAPEVPTRPKLNLQPRSLPLETIGQPVAKRNIFGEGRPHDELAYEEQRKKETTVAVDKKTESHADQLKQSEQASNTTTVFEFAETAAVLQEVSATPAATENVTTATVTEKRDGFENSTTGGRKKKPQQSAGASSSNRGPPATEGKTPRSRGGEDGRPSTREGPGGRGGRSSAESRNRSAVSAPLTTSGAPTTAESNQSSKSKSHGKLASGNKLFQAAVHQTNGGADRKESKKAGAATVNVASSTAGGSGPLSATTPSPVQLTDEERFQRAQDAIKSANNLQAAAINTKPKATGGFAALGGSSDEESDA